MILTIITINRNNVIGLEKTMQSVLSQSRKDFEYVVVDGASTDGSVEVIQRLAGDFGDRLKWISEPDKGIYNAMNKGIRMASGDYLEFLNSGDCLVSDDVLEKVFDALSSKGYPSILYGNMLKNMQDGKIIQDKSFAGRAISFLDFYNGSLNHPSAFIQRILFEKYGFYDESLKVVSDWKWFLQAVVFGGEKPVYTDLDVSLFDMSGISETNRLLTQRERQEVLDEYVCPAILADYREWAPAIRKMKRIRRHPWAYKIVSYIERFLFKIER